MIRQIHFRKAQRIAGFDPRSDGGAQIVEFAVALPLLIVFVVGIFDFSNAYTMKQKLTNIASAAAHTAASEPASDLANPSSPVPESVADAFQMIDSYILENHLSDCGIALSGSAPLYWTFTGSSGCPGGGMTVIINRGYYFPITGSNLPNLTCTPQAGGAASVVATCVSVQYGYQWRFGQAASLLGRNITLPTTIKAVAVAMNEN